MKSLVILTLFIGLFFVMQGVYEQKLAYAEANKKIEYKFVPRTYYEEQLDNSGFYDKVSPLFNSGTPWVGKEL
jgi:hypothetical protein